LVLKKNNFAFSFSSSSTTSRRQTVRTHHHEPGGQHHSNVTVVCPQNEPHPKLDFVHPSRRQSCPHHHEPGGQHHSLVHLPHAEAYRGINITNSDF